MAYTPSQNEELIRLQYEFSKLNDAMTGQWGAETELNRAEPGTEQYKAALKAYNALKPKYDAAKKKLDTLTESINKTKTTQDATNKNQKEIDALKKEQGKAKQDLQRATDKGDADGIAAANQKIKDTRIAIANVGKPASNSNEGQVDD